MSKLLSMFVVVLVVGALVAVVATTYVNQAIKNSPMPTISFIPSPVTSANPTNTPNPTLVQIPLVSLSNKVSQPKTFGCGDSIVFMEMDTTKADLKSAFEKLFSLGDSDVDQNLYNALSSSDLKFDRLEQSAEGTKIYLTGDLSLAGVCDNPRVSQQLIQTAQQNSTADNVEIFINNKKLEEVLSLKGGE